MPLDNLNLPVGASLQVQPTVPQDAPRFMVKVIGYLAPCSLVVTAPRQGSGLQVVREGQRYAVRLLQGDSVVGFVAKVLQSSMRPYPHLHLEYPSEVEQIVVRNAVRVDVELPVLVRNESTAVAPENFLKATIINLSESGGKLESAEPLGAPGDEIHANFKLEVMGQAEALNLVAEVKNQSEGPDRYNQDAGIRYYTGIQFNRLDRFDQILLHAWVMDRVANSGAPPAT